MSNPTATLAALHAAAEVHAQATAEAAEALLPIGWSATGDVVAATIGTMTISVRFARYGWDAVVHLSGYPFDHKIGPSCHTLREALAGVVHDLAETNAVTIGELSVLRELVARCVP